MNQTKERIQSMILFVSDFACILASYYLAGYVWLIGIKGIEVNTSLATLKQDLISIVAIFTLTLLFYSDNEDYTLRGSYRETISVIKTNIIMAAIVAIYQLLQKGLTEIPRGVYVLTLLFNIFIMIVVRNAIKHSLIRYKWTSRDVANMILVTTSDSVDKVLQSFDRRANWLRKLDGIVIVDQDWKGRSIRNIPVVANADDLMSYMKTQIVDDVYISLGYEEGKKLAPLVMDLEDMGITVHLKLEILEYFKDFDVSLEKIGTEPVATFTNQVYDFRQLMFKRVIDIMGAIVGLFFMLLSMIIVAPAIKIESRGPLFFKQKRVGKNGRFFYIYKFRSMYIDAEERKQELLEQNEMNGLMFKIKDDPRITKVGKFLRKTSIDELPQFINVLKGEMSLVGTRPPTVSEFRQYDGHHKRRLSMKPGITGMWQAYGRKTVTDFDQIVEMDLDYIDHFSLSLDVKILLKTVYSVLGGSGQ